MIKKALIILTLLQLVISTSFAQVTYKPHVESQNNNCIIEKVELTENSTIVTIKVPSSKRRGDWVRISSNTYYYQSGEFDPKHFYIFYNGNIPNLKRIGLSDYDIHQMIMNSARKDFPFSFIRSLGNDQLDTQYRIYNATETYYTFTMYFSRIDVGEEVFSIVEDLVWYWCGIKINNPFPKVANVGFNEHEVKQNINENNDGICGIYEDLNDDYKLACIKQNGEYVLVYMGSNNSLFDMSHWKYGDVKAYLRPTATPGFFKADWHMRDKTKETDVYVVFDGATMKTVISGNESNYIKMYPTASSITNPSQNQEWSGSGFALKDGYIVTNYHVIEGAKSIQIQGIKGDFTIKYNAEVIATDKFNDLALLKVSDSKFAGFGTIPYNVKTSVSDVGEDIFVLGYPLTSTMGDEIKLTTGVISSKTGFQGDVSLYQISAPIQPGNSGGPLFDNKGNLVGIVNAKHTGAENVGYAIKTSYLRNLIESSISTNILPTNPQTATLSLPEKVKKLKNFVFMISCSNQSNTGSSYISSSENNSSSVSKEDDKTIIKNPEVIENNDENCKIKTITLTKEYTAIEMTCNNKMANGYYEWCNVNRYAYIKANGTYYKMTRTEGIEISPDKTYFPYNGAEITFTLYFLPIPEDVTLIDFIESDSGWKFYGIELK
ncbi:MAG: serine protease [Bacteroidales bacterium]|nr:serine protease [Bacteroidales bacterium]